MTRREMAQALRGAADRIHQETEHVQDRPEIRRRLEAVESDLRLSALLTVSGAAL